MTPLNKIKQASKAALAAITLTFASLGANAALIPAELSIDGTVTFDDGSSFGATSGSFSVTNLGIDTTSSFTGGVITDTNPLTISSSETGDGFGINGSASTTNDEFVIGFDAILNVTNTSLTDSFDITFELIFDNLVNGASEDSYAQSHFEILEGGAFLFDTYLMSDTAGGNINSDGTATGFGGELQESGTQSFTFSLAPSEILSLAFSWTADGGEYFDADSASVNFSQSFKVKSATNTSGQPQPVPEQTSILLVALSLVLLGRKKLSK